MPSFSLKNATRTQISIRSSITIHFYTGVTPVTYRLDAFRKKYMKGGLIGTYVYLAFQKPFRESPSSGTSHSRSRGKFHDTARPSACGKATLLRMIAGLDVHGEVKQMGADACLLLGMVQNAITTHKSNSLVGSNSKRMTLTPLSSSCVGSDSRRVISPSLTTPNFSVRRRMMSSRHRKQPLPWHCQRHSLRHTGTLLVLPMRKHEKSGKILEATSLLPEMRPCIVLVIDIMLFGSDIYSLFPLYNTMAILVITYAILFLPYTAEYIASA